MVRKQERLSADELAKTIGFLQPTKEQAKIVEHPPYVEVGGDQVASPLLVVAGAGSGKTKTLSLRAAYLAAEHGVEGQNILGLTFTRKAAAELAENLSEGLTGVQEAKEMASGGGVEPFAFLLNTPEATTYNAFALSVVQEFGTSVGITPGVEHMGEAASWQLMSEVVAGWAKEMRGDSSEETTVSNALSLREDIANQGMTIKEGRKAIERLAARFQVLRTENSRSFTKPFQEALEALHVRLDLLDVVEEFEARKLATGRMDYSDQVNAAIRIVENSPEARRVLRERHQVVFLDEFQDTSVSQMRFLATLFKDHPVTAVGDPNQAIYGWRGASAGALEDFHQEFTAKGVQQTTLRLTTAWRNSKTVLDVANKIAAPLLPTEANTHGQDFTKEDATASNYGLRPRKGAPHGNVVGSYAMTDQDSIDEIVAYVGRLREAAKRGGRSKPLTVAVLARTNRPLLPIVEALRAKDIPAQLAGGDSLLKHPAVVDLRAALEITSDIGQSASLARLLTNLDLGAADLMALGMASRRISRDADADGENPQILLEAVEAVREGETVAGLSEEGHFRVKGLGEKLSNLRAGASSSLVTQVENARDLLQLDEDGWASLGSGGATDVLDLFQAVAADYENSSDRPTMAGFLSWLQAAEEKERGIQVPSIDIDPQVVQVLTVHSSKGLEWDAVVVAELVAGRFPDNSSRGAKIRKGQAPQPPDSPAPSAGWWKNPGVLPYPCRLDRAHLPDPNIWDSDEGGTARYDLFREEVGAHQEEEERRLAYVAFTRARDHLLLTGAWFSTAKNPRFPSIFFEEAAETETEDGDKAVAVEKVELPPQEDWEASRQVEKTASFPREPGLTRRQGRQAAMRVLDHVENLKELDEKRRREQALATIKDVLGGDGQPLAEQLKLLLEHRDREAKEAGKPEDLTPEDIFAQTSESRVLSATEIADFASDPKKGALELVRPVPTKPVADSVLGQAFHYWAEHHLGRVSASAAQLDPDDTPFAMSLAAEEKAMLRMLTNTFQGGVVPSDWRVVGVEVPFFTQAGEFPVRGRVDAVFQDPDGTLHLVDWKTRRSQVDKISPSTVAYYQKQLEVYLGAWRQRGERGADVDARIVFVSPEAAQTLEYGDLVAAADAGEGITLRR